MIISVMMKILFVLICSVILSLKAETLVIVGDENYLPIIGNNNNNNNQASGILIERLKIIEKKLTGTVGFTYALYPWARALALSRTSDVGIVGISMNEERKLIYDFSLPIYSDSILLVTRKDKVFKYRKFSDLIDRTIGAQMDASFGEDFDSYASTNKLKIIRDVDRVARLQKVLFDRIDVALIGNGIEGYNQLLKSNRELWLNKDKFVILPKKLVEDNLYIAFSKSLNRKELIKSINKVIKVNKLK